MQHLLIYVFVEISYFSTLEKFTNIKRKKLSITMTAFRIDRIILKNYFFLKTIVLTSFANNTNLPSTTSYLFTLLKRSPKASESTP